MSFMNESQITVTSPLMPSLEEFNIYLQDIWQRKWITNNGCYHDQLEKALAEYLKVPYISLFTNGTLPLITALQALRITGEVITTPYSFVATSHSLWWNGIQPVFVDVNPCDSEAIQAIANKYNLKVIYDAAHAFGVEVDSKSVLEAGDMSILSFHATKVYNTIEGGAIVVRDEKTKKQIDHLKNFGFAGETEVVAPGINGKMDEIRAAYGLLNLKQVDAAISNRRHIADMYRKALCKVEGIAFMKDVEGVRHNYSYFPIFVDAEKYGMTRDELYFKMKKHHILGRRYFYPLISSFPTYRSLQSARKENLPVATKLAEQVICLPMYSGLSGEDIERILWVIENKD